MSGTEETVVVSPVAEEEVVLVADPVKVRAIMIKTGVAKRLAKEKLSYDKEVLDQTAKIEKFKQEGKVNHSLVVQILRRSVGRNFVY